MRMILILAALLLIFPVTVYAEPPAGKAKNDSGLDEAFEEVIDDIVDTFTDDSSNDVEADTPGAKGRSNAVEQIEKNIEKNNAGRQGLENARENVMKGGQGKSAATDNDGNLMDKIIEDLGEGAKDEIDQSFDEPPKGGPPADRGHSGKDRGKSRGKGR